MLLISRTVRGGCKTFENLADLGGLYADMVHDVLANIEDTFADISTDDLKAAADAIWSSRTVFTLGVGVNNSVARNFTYLASTGMTQFHAIPRPGSTPVDDLAWADKRDVLIAMTCKPYRVEVVEAVKIAREQGMTIIALSDSPASPIIRDADHGFCHVGGYAAVLSVFGQFDRIAGNAVVFCYCGGERGNCGTGGNLSQASPSARSLLFGGLMTDPIKSLAARYYTDPAVFQIETKGLLARTWQFGCHGSELADVGSYATFEIAGESLFAIRGRDEKIRVFYNVCQHRAHQLVSGTGQTRVGCLPLSRVDL